jgi:hypothetical protein
VLSFDPPKLRDDLARAIEVWKRKVGVNREDDFSDEIVDVTLPGFSPDEYEDRTITPDTKFKLFLPEWEDAAIISYASFVELTEELEQASLIRGHACLTERRYLLRVAAANDETYVRFERMLPEPESEDERKSQLAYIERNREASALRTQLHRSFEAGTDTDDARFDQELFDAWQVARREALEHLSEIDKPTRRYLTMPVSYDGIEATCSLTTGFTVFGPAVAASGDYDKDLPPIGSWEAFVEVRFRVNPLSEDNARYLVEAYLFELSSSVGLEFKVDSRPSLHYEDPEEPEWRMSYDARLRPLLLGRGMPELLRLYNRATVATDDEIRILYFTKVMEYVSQTVVRQKANEAIRAKLLSPRSLDPDATFVTELQAVVEKQRVFHKDREAVRQTAVVCCEASDLSRVAPPFLSKLSSVLPTDSPKKREDALAELGASLYATRNQIAHAKANYKPVGEECPEEQLAAFAECAKVAAQQAVRWYHSAPEKVRVL